MTKNQYKRVFHHYLKCEEYRSNMWGMLPVKDREQATNNSRSLMIDCDRFEEACKRAIDEWPNSTEAALTASTMNHQAWIGHAACALNHGAPEDLTRMAWRSMNQDEQDAANTAADRAIEYWEDNYVFNQNNGSYSQLVLPLDGADIWQQACGA